MFKVPAGVTSLSITAAGGTGNAGANNTCTATLGYCPIFGALLGVGGGGGVGATVSATIPVDSSKELVPGEMAVAVNYVMYGGNSLSPGGQGGGYSAVVAGEVANGLSYASPLLVAAGGGGGGGGGTAFGGGPGGNAGVIAAPGSDGLGGSSGGGAGQGGTVTSGGACGLPSGVTYTFCFTGSSGMNGAGGGGSTGGVDANYGAQLYGGQGGGGGAGLFGGGGGGGGDAAGGGGGGGAGGSYVLPGASATSLSTNRGGTVPSVSISWSAPEAPKGQAKYLSKISSLRSNSKISFTYSISVKNVSNASGRPSCKISLGGVRTTFRYVTSKRLSSLAPTHTAKKIYGVRLARPLAKLLSASRSKISCK